MGNPLVVKLPWGFQKSVAHPPPPPPKTTTTTTTAPKTKTANIMCFSGAYHYKIAKNRPILMKLTVPNRQDFAIFKKLRFFKFGRIFIGEGSDLQIFGRLKSYVCS